MTRIIFFDGPCGLCNRFVIFVLKRDRQRRFQFSALQSNFSKKTLPERALSLDSVVYQENGQFYFKSEAIIKILSNLGGVYNGLARLLSLLPKNRLDYFYQQLAQHRKKLFRNDFCFQPGPEEKQYFL